MNKMEKYLGQWVRDSVGERFNNITNLINVLKALQNRTFKLQNVAFIISDSYDRVETI